MAERWPGGGPAVGQVERSRAERLALLADARLYLCTPARPDLERFLDAVLAAGVDLVQLREKGIEARAELELCAVVARVAERHGALWSVNDRADVAWAARPDVLHLGQDDLPVPVARGIVGGGVLVGRSTHAVAEVDAAAVEPGVDYFCAGPCWPTPTKPGRPAPGLDLVVHAAAVAPFGDPAARPWFAIGGIDLTNVGEVVSRGARRAVVVRAVTEAGDPAAAAAALAAALRA